MPIDHKNYAHFVCPKDLHHVLKVAATMEKLSMHKFVAKLLAHYQQAPKGKKL